MATDAVPGPIPVHLVQGSQATKPITVQVTSGNSLPPGGKEKKNEGKKKNMK